MRRIKQIMGILLSWILLMGIFQFLPIDIDGGKAFAAAVQSGDNSLSSLSISPGTLSPAFQYNIVDYTASVEADVTSIEVNAALSNDTATIESVSGNTDLQPGENLVSIVVKAQDGTPATYKIVVTRQAGDGAVSQPADNAAQEPQADGANADGITIDGQPFDVAPTISDDLVPQDFTKATVNCQGQQVESLSFAKEDLTLVYLTTPSADVKNMLAVYEESDNHFYPFRKIQFDEANYLIILNPPAESGLPEDYTQTTQTIGEYQNIPAYANGAEFSLVYGISSYGNKGWYQYDTVEATFQRYTPEDTSAKQEEPAQSEEDTMEPSAEMQSLQNAYTQMEEQYNNQRDTSRKTTAVMAFVIAVLLVVVVNLLLRGKKSEEDEWEEELDYDELSEKVREQVKSARKSRREGNLQDKESAEDADGELWEDDSVPKSILKQQTKIIPQLGEELQNDRERRAAVAPEKREEPKIEISPELESDLDEDFEVIDLEDL